MIVKIVDGDVYDDAENDYDDYYYYFYYFCDVFQYLQSFFCIYRAE